MSSYRYFISSIAAAYYRCSSPKARMMNVSQVFEYHVRALLPDSIIRFDSAIARFYNADIRIENLWSSLFLSICFLIVKSGTISRDSYAYCFTFPIKSCRESATVGNIWRILFDASELATFKLIECLNE